MADNEKKSQNSEGKVVEKDSGKGNSMLLWILVAVMIGVGAGGGFFLATLMAKPKPQTQTQPEQTQPQDQIQELISEETQEIYYHELDPVVACLDEPSLSRYVRATLIIQMKPGFDPVAGAEFLEKKEPLLSNWLTKYLAGLSLIQVQGTRNLDRVQMEIFEEFNQILFENKKPMVDKILFKEFVIN